MEGGEATGLVALNARSLPNLADVAYLMDAACD
jgi:hypothetical protein